MTPQSSEWKKMVLRGARQLGIVLTPGQLDCFAQHATLLLEWNRKINLTAIVDPAEMAVKHYLDAIAPIKHIPLQGHLLDIGTGGGFPGIPLKVMRPDQPMTLIDGVRKKISFIKQAIRQLGLQGIEAHQMRAEDLGRRPSEATQYQVIVCRALTDLSAIVTLSTPLLAPGGSIVAYQGAETGDLDFKPDGLAGFAIQSHAYRLPISDDYRSVTILTKQ
jgi:16S rRNA (guanine527-N7)-methyltransferase